MNSSQFDVIIAVIKQVIDASRTDRLEASFEGERDLLDFCLQAVRKKWFVRGLKKLFRDGM